MTVPELQKICNTHVVEINFTRRNLKSGSPPKRRILCTRSGILLNSTLGKEILNFKKPTQPHPYNAASKGLVTVWDIIMQDWRNIPAAACNVIMAVAVEPQEKFWKWFDMKIKPMTTLAKESFINEANTTSYGTKPSGKSFYNIRSYGGRFYKVK